MKNKGVFIALFNLFFVVGLYAQDKIMYDSLAKKDVLINSVDITSLKEFKLTKSTSNYMPKKHIIEKLSKNFGHYRMTVILGSWCSDCQKHIPEFLKILQEANYDAKKVHFIAVNKQRMNYDNSLKDIDFNKIPTIILYKGKKEIGRIVENPVKSLEEDLWSIISHEQKN